MAAILRRFVASFSLDDDQVDLVTPECVTSIPAMWAVVMARLA